MKARNEKQYKRKRRHLRVRNKIVGTPERPRLCVFRSSLHIYAQLVDDTSGHTIAASSSLKLGVVQSEDKASKKIQQAREVGKLLAENAKAKGISRVVFDRGGYLYHGRVAALAEGARKNGLEF
ncbi:MAG: 50S ribosomal protein L18 [Chitinivibrionia bacterium]|nr:50S ribosomal protein L18 [Chitinivibrionia bacterium]